MATVRDLDWPECINVRDLGGLPTVAGGATRFGAVVRSDHPSYLRPQGWTALWSHGVRTVISLETDGADPSVARLNNLPFADGGMRPDLVRLRLRIEDGDDREFVTRWAESGLWMTPLYFSDAMRRWPRRIAALVRHVARSGPGGVLIHCGRGCDRTGLATAVLLWLAGVDAEDIADDYASSAARLAPREPGYAERLDAALAEHHTSVEQVFRELVDSIDIDEYLLAAGAAPEDLSAVRQRLASATVTTRPPVPAGRARADSDRRPAHPR